MLKLAFIAVLYYLVARWSLTLAFEGSSASPIWPPSGIALAAVFLLGGRAAPAILMGAFSANLMQFYSGSSELSQASLLVSIAIASGNTLEALIALYLTRRWLPHENIFAQPLHIFKFTLIVLLACAIAACIGSSSLLAGEFISSAVLFSVWLNWWLGDMAGVMVLTPLLLTWLPLRKSALSTQQLFESHKLIENVVTAILVLGVSWLIFGGYFQHQRYDRLLIYTAILALAWVAYRYSNRGVTLTVAGLSSVAVYATIKGLRPFNNGNLNDSLILLVSFITMFSLTGLLLSSDLSSRAITGKLASRQPNHAWFTLVGLLGFTIVAWHLTALDTEKIAQKQFKTATQEIESQIIQKMKVYEQILQGGVALFAASNAVTQQEWHDYYQTLELAEKLPEILGFGFAKYIENSEKTDFIAKEKSARGDDFTIKPAGKRDFYAVAQYLEPSTPDNNETLGFDMYSEQNRRFALQAAMQTGLPQITGKVTLYGETDATKSTGILMYIPVYGKGAEIMTVGEREHAIAGFVYARFRMVDLMASIMEAKSSQISLRIFDDNIMQPARLMYTSDPGKAALPAYASRDTFKVHSQIEIADHAWGLHFGSLPFYEDNIDRQKAQLVLLAGFLISILLFIMVRALTVGKEAALALAKQMTSALSDSEAKYHALAVSANEAILVINLQGLIVSWNQAAATLFGYAQAEIIQQHLSKVLPDHQKLFSSVDGKLNIDSSLNNETAQTLESTGLSRNGRIFPIEISLSGWLSDEERYFSAFIRDISARKSAEIELQTSEKRFRSMMEHAPIGMALVSLSGQWMQINDAVCDIVGYARDDLIKMTFQEITYAADLANDMGYLNQLVANEIASYQIEKRYIHKNGSLVWVMLSVSLLRDENAKPLYFISQIENINDQKLAQIHLNETLAFQSAILASADQLIIATDTAGIIKGFNQAAEFKLGYQAAEVINQHTPTRFHLENEIILRADALSQEFGVQVKPGFEVFVLKTKFGEKDENEWTYRRKDGSTFPVILSVTSIIDTEGTITGYLGVASDITERKRSEQVLLAESKYLNSVIEGTNAGTWQWHVATGECRFNERWATMLGYQLQELGGQMYETWSRLAHPDDIPSAIAAMNKHFSGETEMFEAEFRMQHKTGDWVWILSRGRVLNWTDDKQPAWMYGTHIDVTERKRIDLELRQAYSNLEEFTAIASHDLKTPLRGIADLSDWIEEDLGSNIADTIKNNLNRIKIRVLRMDALITELLHYARASVKSEDHHTLVDPLVMVHGIIDLLAISPAFKVNVSGNIPPFKTSATPLETIVRNLISNAVKHHDRTDGNIEIKLYRQNNFNVFEIADDGPGIPKSAQERVFRLFQTLSKSETSTGVGLAVSRRMAEAHGGKIILESSTENRRTVFTVLWPGG